MASTTLFNFSSSLFNPLRHPQPNRPKALLSSARINPRRVSSINDHLAFTRVTYPLLRSRSAHKRRFHVGATKEHSDGESSESLVSDATYQEEFSWSSVILPFLFPALGGLLFGYDIGATSGAAISLQSPELSGITWFNLSSIQLGLVFAKTLGRRRQLIAAATLYLFGGVITAYAPELGVLLAGRLLYGLGIEFTEVETDLYDVQLGYFVGSFLIDTVGAWRFMYGFSAPIATLMGLGMLTLPPSPRWLLLRAVQGKGSFQDLKEKAIVSLSKLRGRPPGDKESEKQIEETLLSMKSAYADQESGGNFFEVFQGPNLKAFIIGGGLVLFQQSAGFSAASDATKVSVVIGSFKLLMTGFAVLKVDDLGRRPLLIGGVSGIALSLVLLSAYYKFLGDFPLVAVGALLLYVGCYQISFGPISWLMVSEVFPLRTRGKGISLAVLTNFASNAVVTFAFSPLKELLGAENLFLLFGAIAILSLLFIIFSVPETKGLSLEEIESKILKEEALTKKTKFMLPKPKRCTVLTKFTSQNN
ncbi:D-xylose-proton symporter-like 3, chloroplastic, partial [Mucuna pruriens]